ncbi:RibD family protein [Roseomonas sp. BN140053]|uniref:RibD family protein n=1 Tax=Roseomonas sp. BN140053 TaxID=3391898 RepID=UPI0039ED3AD6
MLDEDGWDALLRARHDGAAPARLDPALDALFAPLLAAPEGEDGCLVLGRLAQTLDGRIATAGGHSQWIGGQGDIRHTHRLRALFDAVLVGAGTVAADDPRLTTREARGPDPVRVVLDPERRLPAHHRVFCGGPPTLLCCAADAPGAEQHGTAEVLRLPRDAGGVSLPALLRALAARGLRRVFVEGGGVTVSRFLAAGLLDRLHLTVAPVILGSGRPAFVLPEAMCIADGMRFGWTVHPLGDDVLFDIPLRRARPGNCA